MHPWWNKKSSIGRLFFSNRAINKKFLLAPFSLKNHSRKKIFFVCQQAPRKYLHNQLLLTKIFLCIQRESFDIKIFGNNNSNSIYTCRLFSFICPPFCLSLSLPKSRKFSQTLFYYEIILRTHMTSSSSQFFVIRVYGIKFFVMKSETTMKME